MRPGTSSFLYALPKYNKGAALLVLLSLVLVVFCTALIGSLQKTNSDALRKKETEKILALAKEALIGWSASRSATPGMLPCIEDTALIGMPNEGQALSACSNSLPLIGRLPWRTLGLPDLRDSAGERLWYAISPGFRNSPINSDTPAQLTVDGNPNSAVAIIFSAGAPLSGQNRTIPTAGAPPDVAQYLDGINNNGTGNFITTNSAIPFNDLMITISPKDLFSVVQKRVAREVRLALLNHFCGVSNYDSNGNCIAAGGNRFFPRPALFNDTTCLGSGSITTGCNSGGSNNAGRIPANPSMQWEPTLSLLRGSIASTPNWFQVNGWREHVYYAVANACIDGTLDCNGSGKLTVNDPPKPPTPNQRIVVIVAGKILDTTTPPQDRSTLVAKGNPANYLEDENLLPLDNIFTRQPSNQSTPFNDHVFMLP